MEGTLGRVTGVSELDPEKLFIHGVDVDTLDETSGYTALQLACQEGYKDLIQWLLDDAQVPSGAGEAWL